MRVLVCGGRDFHERGTVYRTLNTLNRDRGPFSLVISGGATGADDLARHWAILHRKIPFRQFSANWKKYGSAAGPIRNQQMLDGGKPNLVVAFPGGVGTADMVRRARAAGVEVIEIR